jgi:hypothetical protein
MELVFTACGGLCEHMTWNWLLLPVGICVRKWRGIGFHYLWVLLSANDEEVVFAACGGFV